MSMKTYERRQEILSALREQPELKIAALADQLGVSPGTIRNDLKFLTTTRQVKRTRGGATLANSHLIANAEFAARAGSNAYGKRAIARWSADLVKDGDAIFLDDSTTAFHMVAYLHDRRDLTVVTNGIETALAAARNPSATVVLLGGIVRAKTNSVFGKIGEVPLDGLHIRTAFVSCSGFSVRTGFTEPDVETAQLKRKVMDIAERVVALVESSKFGVVQFSSFARADQVTQIMTDAQVDREMIEQIRQATTLTVCGDKSTSSYTPVEADTRHYRIGFAGLGEERPFGVAVRQSLEAAALDARHIDLIIGDNQYSSEAALEVSDTLIRDAVELAIAFHHDEKIGSLLVGKFNRANIPVITVDTPMIGATFFGIDNYRAGYDGGVALGQWIKERWGGRIDRLVVLERQAAGPTAATRILSQIDGLQDIIGRIPEAKRIYLQDEEGSAVAMAERLANVLQPLPRSTRVAVISFNDPMVEGLIEAAKASGREDSIVCASLGAGTRKIRDELRRPDSMVAAAILFPPDAYGRGLVELAGRILRNERVPPAVYIDHILLDSSNIYALHPDP
jgi:ribose transport system substrate-binding protein